MDKFIVDPSDCVILKALRDSNSLREAAALLGCDPAGLARKVQQISSQTGFTQKINNRWQVTARGLDLVIWAEESIQSQKQILSSGQSLRIASTMWFSEEVIVPNILELRRVLGEQATFSFSVPKKTFESALSEGSIDFVIACHPPENPEIEHRQIAQEEWIIIAPPSWQKKFKNRREYSLNDLASQPMIRHTHLNLDVFMPNLNERTDFPAIFDNIISVRSAVREGLGWSLVPKILVSRDLKEKRVIQIPYDLKISDRKVCLWWLRNRRPMKPYSEKLSSWLKKACANA